MKSIILTMLFCMGCTSKNNQNLLGYDFRLFNNTPCKTLAEAVKNEDVENIRSEVLNNKIPVDCREPKFNRTLLMLAVENHKYKAVEVLLQLNANPNKHDKSGETGLTEALHIGAGGIIHDDADPRYLKLMLQYGGDPNAVNNNSSAKQTVLETACFSGVLQYVKILVDAGAKLNVQNQNLLYGAVISANPDIVLYLLRNEVDYKRPLSMTGEGKKQYLLDLIDRTWRFDRDSEQYQKELAIRQWLYEHEH